MNVSRRIAFRGHDRLQGERGRPECRGNGRHVQAHRHHLVVRGPEHRRRGAASHHGRQVHPDAFRLPNVTVCLPGLEIVNGPAYVEHAGKVTGLQFGSSTAYTVCSTPASLIGFVADSVPTTSWRAHVPNV